jgi:hypothetical protein
MAIAAQSVLVFTISVGPMDFFGRSFFGRYSIVSACPFTEVEQFAALAAKRPVRIA